MDLALSSEQKQLVATFEALYRREAAPEAVRAAEPVGYDRSLWASLCRTGVVEMAVAQDHGGLGGSMLDLVLVAELHGRAVAPAPVVEAQTAARLLARCGPAAADLLTAALAGDRLVTVAPRPPRDGALPLVPAGAVADTVVARVGDAIVAVPGQGHQVRNLGSQPLADVRVGRDPATVLAGRPVAQVWAAAVDDWQLLTAASLVGVAARALETGVAYAKERQAFGVPIGSFQAVAHPLADAATAVDGARLLSHRAAWSFEADPDRVREFCALSYAVACEAAREATRHSLHVHGGYGFVMESDIQLYFRRARAWAQVYGTPAEAFERVADSRYGPLGAA